MCNQVLHIGVVLVVYPAGTSSALALYQVAPGWVQLGISRCKL